MSNPITTHLDGYSTSLFFGGARALAVLCNSNGFLAFLSDQEKDYRKQMLLGLKLLVNTIVDRHKFVLERGGPFDFQHDLMTRRAIFKGIPMERVPSDSDLAKALRGLEKRTKEALEAKTVSRFFKVIHDRFEVYASIIDRIYKDNTSFLEPYNSLSEESKSAFLSLELLADLMQFKMIKIPLKSGGTDFLIGERTGAFKTGGLFGRMFLGYKMGFVYLWRAMVAQPTTSKCLADIQSCQNWEELFSVYKERIRDCIDEIERSLGVYTLGRGIIKTECITTLPLDLLSETFVGTSTMSVSEKIDAGLLWYDTHVMDGGKSNIYTGVPAFVSLLRGLVDMRKIEAEESLVQVRRLIHSISDESQDGWISYATLVPCYGTAWSDASGWIVHLNCCNNFTGGASSLMRLAEEPIAELADAIEIQDIHVTEQELKDYLKDRIKQKSRSFGTPLTRPELVDFLLEPSYRLSAALIELFVATNLAERGYQIRWRHRDRATIGDYEIDVLAWNDKEGLVVECMKTLPRYGVGVSKLRKEMREKRELVRTNILTNLMVHCEIMTTDNPEDEEVQHCIKSLNSDEIEVRNVYDIIHESNHKTSELEDALIKIDAAMRTDGNIFRLKIDRGLTDSD
jgi:hypothetical protein